MSAWRTRYVEGHRLGELEFPPGRAHDEMLGEHGQRGVAVAVVAVHVEESRFARVMR